MIEMIYRCTCDRCGKEIPFKARRVVAFEQRTENTTFESVGSGDVCAECHEDFIELAKSFFDDLDKEQKQP